MRDRFRNYTMLCLIAVVFAAQPVSADGEAKPAAAPDTEWRLHGNDVGEQRHSVLRQINTGNVDRLGLVWSFDMYIPSLNIPIRFLAPSNERDRLPGQGYSSDQRGISA